jgi:hypothetical protein
MYVPTLESARHITLPFTDLHQKSAQGLWWVLYGTYIDEPRVVSLLDVVEDGGLVEAGEVGHVLLLVILGRVHLLHVILHAEVTLSVSLLV